MKLTRHFVVFLLIGVLPSTYLFGSTCATIDPARVVSEAEIIFVGKAIFVQASDYSPGAICRSPDPSRPTCGGKIVTLEVVRSFKGVAPGNVKVLVEDGCYCLGGYFKVADDYIIVAKKNPTAYPADFLAMNVCWGTGPLMQGHSKRVFDQLINQKQPLIGPIQPKD